MNRYIRNIIIQKIHEKAKKAPIAVEEINPTMSHISHANLYAVEIWCPEKSSRYTLHPKIQNEEVRRDMNHIAIIVTPILFALQK